MANNTNGTTVAQVENNQHIGIALPLETRQGQSVSEKGGSVVYDSAPHQEHGPLIDHKIPQVSDLPEKKRELTKFPPWWACNRKRKKEILCILVEAKAYIFLGGCHCSPARIALVTNSAHHERAILRILRGFHPNSFRGRSRGSGCSIRW